MRLFTALIAIAALSGCATIADYLGGGTAGEVLCSFAAKECPKIAADGGNGKVLCDAAASYCSGK